MVFPWQRPGVVDFNRQTDPRVEAFTESISFDARLYEVDIRGSKAHATMLAAVGILTNEERELICSVLDQIGGEIAGGSFGLLRSWKIFTCTSKVH